MKRRTVVIAGVATTLGLLVPTGAGAQPVVKGTLVGADGTPASGVVSLQAWPVGPAPKKAVRYPIVARGRTDRAGRFVLAVKATRKLRQMASLNDQRRLDFTVRGIAAGRVTQHSVSRFLTRDGRFVAPGAEGLGGLVGIAKASGDELRLKGGDRLAPRVRAASPARLLDECVTNDRVVDTSPGVTVIGELNNAYRDSKAQWAYGSGGTTSVKLHAAPGGEDWVNIDSTAKKTDEAEVSEGPVSTYSRRQYSEFEYEKVKITSGCTGKSKNGTRVKRWLGDHTRKKQRGAIRVCDKSDRVRTAIQRGRGFRRASKNATEWEGGAKVFGAGLTVQSGFSKYIRVKYKWGGPSGRAHYLCGDDGPPTSSGRIFTGLKRGG